MTAPADVARQVVEDLVKDLVKDAHTKIRALEIILLQRVRSALRDARRQTWEQAAAAIQAALPDGLTPIQADECRRLLRRAMEQDLG